MDSSGKPLWQWRRIKAWRFFSVAGAKRRLPEAVWLGLEYGTDSNRAGKAVGHNTYIAFNLTLFPFFTFYFSTLQFLFSLLVEYLLFYPNISFPGCNRASEKKVILILYHIHDTIDLKKISWTLELFPFATHQKCLRMDQ